MSEEKTAVVPVATGGALAPSEQSVIEALLAEQAGAGATDVGSKDRAIPFLAVLQKGSPQVDDTSGKYLEGAKQGMAFNTVTGELFDTRNTPIPVIDCFRANRFVEWTPRDQGGGFVGQHLPDSPIVKTAREVIDGKKRKLVLPNGNILVDTMYHYVILIGEEGAQWAVIGMSSTQLRTSRKWNMIIDTQTLKKPGTSESYAAPSFAFTYLLSTKAEQNEFGSWFGWDVKKGDLVSDTGVLHMAIMYRNAVQGGTVQVATPVNEHADPAAGTTGAAAGEDVPF